MSDSRGLTRYFIRVIFAVLMLSFLNAWGDENQPQPLTGVVSSIETGTDGKKIIHFQTATDNINLDYNSLPAPTQQAVSTSGADKITTVLVDKSAILSDSQVVGGVRPDCSELPLSISDLDTLAKSGNVNSMVDFLKAIPQGSMQNFTLVANSLSLQRGGVNGSHIVNPTWPRAVRFSSDGKLTLTFVCDPNNSAYGTVEAIYFDDKDRKLETKEYQFTNNGVTVPPANRIHDNPTSCVACHSSRKGFSGNNQSPQSLNQTIKFNWPEYPLWSDCDMRRGISVYGADDDRLGGSKTRGNYSDQDHQPKDCEDSKLPIEHAQEVKNYATFRQIQKSNTCFNTLPWPSPSPSPSVDFTSYPYANSDIEAQNSTFRPNLRFTDVATQITAMRDAKLLKNAGSYYNLMKYYIAMEAANCLTEDDQNKITQMLGTSINLDGDTTDVTQGEGLQPLLLGFAKNVGFTAADWSLEFQAKSDPTYNAGDNYGIGSLVAGSVLRDIANENSAIKAVVGSAIMDPVTADQKMYAVPGKSDYSCIDKDGGSLGGFASTENNQTTLGPGTLVCQVLHTENDKNLPAALAAFQKDGGLACLQKNHSDSDTIQALNGQVSHVVGRLSQASIDRGRQLVQPDSKGKCVACHSAGVQSGLPPDFRFVPDSKASTAQYNTSLAVLNALVKEGSFSKLLDQNLIQNASMPPGGSTLTSQDRQDIDAYITSLEGSAKQQQ